MLLKDLGRRLAIVEESANLVDFLSRDLKLAECLSEHMSGCDQLHDETERGSCTNGGELSKSVFLNFNALGCATNAENLDNFVKGVRQSTNDKKSIQEIDGDTVG